MKAARARSIARNPVEAGMLRAVAGLELRALSAIQVHRFGRLAAAVEARRDRVQALSDEGLRLAAEACRRNARGGTLAPEIVREVFALGREAVRRRLGIEPYRVQLIGGAGLLAGAVTEMQTGEGKTVTAVLPALAMALAGRAVHVITANDYLVQRDASQLREVYASLGVRVGCAIAGQDRQDRQEAWCADVTYCTGKELVFDFLRDQLAVAGGATGPGTAMLGRGAADALLARGLDAAIVDEADSILIDEARTPLILAESAVEPGTGDRHATALRLASELREGAEFTIEAETRRVRLTEAGRDVVAERAGGLSGYWASPQAREELVQNALAALHLLRRGRDYVVADEGVQIVDEQTGRVLPGRTWQNGLHQLVELKEGRRPTPPTRTLARITYQRFFRRYATLCGMTGTGAEAAGELRSAYGLRVVRVPTHRRCRRRALGAIVFAAGAARDQEVVRRAAVLAQSGRPVLVGTRSVTASEEIAGCLQGSGAKVAVLNAVQHAEEAVVIARAGQVGRVTVATNMAGRGTDIRLDPAARACEGLHVILTEYHESSRIDRQLFGRAGRQGDPGTGQALVSLEDELFRRFCPPLLRSALSRIADRNAGVLPAALGGLARAIAQARAERFYAGIRADTLAEDEAWARALAFAGVEA